MKIVYRTLLNFNFHHGYYSDPEDSRGFCIHPTPRCSRILENHHIIFRRTPGGFSLFCRIEPDTKPPKMMRGFDDVPPKLEFWIEAVQPPLVGISKLPEYKPAKECFYFDNLSDQRTTPVGESPLYLGDSTSDKILGDPLTRISCDMLTYEFKPAVTSAILTLKNLFNTEIKAIPIRSKDPISNYRLNLNQLFSLKPGRYTLSDNHGGIKPFYYAPELSEKAVFGLLDIHITTVDHTPDNSEKVPGTYQFLTPSGTLSGLDPYAIRLDSRSTTWRYVVIKKYKTNGIPLSGLTVLHQDGAVNFDKTADTGQIIFTADDSLPVKENEKPVELHRSGNKIRELPAPSLNTPLQQHPDVTGLSSDIYVYV